MELVAASEQVSVQRTRERQVRVVRAQKRPLKIAEDAEQMGRNRHSKILYITILTKRVVQFTCCCH